eukprot:CAMPEP_0178826984 /NCGR_PEP_ID=MMETSP0746-20121128/7026_1 /TAXON_ID=913974 /ORGANISM="Nitzschia punctata, Strain CCMP561" /LENGTH=338 /DNA_ID=CAMNT_0020488811 /DNA_START=1 /DNA_END=1017 /DNA_ORIENTATION=-
MAEPVDSGASHIGTIPTLVYILCSFIANAGVSITGFGMALIFVFVFTIFDVLGCMKDCPEGMCDMKYVVCLQSLSLVGSMPFLIYKAKAWNANQQLLSTLVPVTLVSTPAGQWCQTYVASSWIRMVVGVVVTVVVGYEIYKMCMAKRTSNNATSDEAATPTSERAPLLISKEEGVQNGSDSMDHENSNGSDDTLHGFSHRAIVSWGVVLGFFSGFLGGLIGMRGPPLMIFFLHFPFPKSEARSVGAVLLFLNMALRMGFYILQDLHIVDDNNSGKWFDWEYSWHLYFSIVVAGVLGVPIGDWVHHRIDQSRFRVALAVLLAFTGIVNILKAASELRGE